MRLSSRFSGAFWMFFLCVVASTNLFALHARTPMKRQRATRRHVRHIYWNPVLKGSHESMLRQNAEINELQLPRIANEEELLSLEVRDELVPVSDVPRVAPRAAPGRHSPLLPEMDAAVYREHFRSVLPQIQQAALGYLAGSHRRATASTAAAQPERGARRGRHYLFPPGWNRGRFRQARRCCRANGAGSTSTCWSCNGKDWWRRRRSGGRLATTSWFPTSTRNGPPTANWRLQRGPEPAKRIPISTTRRHARIATFQHLARSAWW